MAVRLDAKTNTGAAPGDLEVTRNEPSALRQGIEKVRDSFIISGLINLTGSAFVHFAFGTPFDPKIILSFQVIGTLIGTCYGPAKDMLLARLASQPNKGAPLCAAQEPD